MGRKRKVEKDYHELAKSRGFKWIGEVLPKDVRIPTLWECEKKDRWLARYSDIQRGDGCPICCGLAKKVEQNYHELAKNRGFKWVGQFPKNVTIKTLWECEEGHRWVSKYNSINSGYGCPSC